MNLTAFLAQNALAEKEAKRSGKGKGKEVCSNCR